MKKFYFFPTLILLGNMAMAQLTTVKSNFGDPGGAGIGNRVVYVNFNDGAFGSTDGSAGGTIDVPPATVVLYAQNAAQLGTKIVFIGFNLATGDELWSSDGTIAGTGLIKDINPTPGTGSAPQGNQEGFSVVGTTLYFSANDGTNGRELWKTDGTTGGTAIVKDITAGVGSTTITFPYNMYASGATMYFIVNGNQLWKTDGTDPGTLLVKDFSAGGASSISSMFVSNGTYTFFVANDGTNGWELWRTDGTTGGTILLQNIGTGSSNGFTINASNLWDWNFHIFNNVLYFQPNGPGVSGNKLYRSDGTIGNTAMVIDFNSSGGGYIDLQNAMDRGSSFYFNTEGELYKSDGTLAGSVMVKDIYPGPNGSNPELLSPRENLGTAFSPGLFAGGRFFFIADDGTNGKELWVSDGSAAGTVMVKNIHPSGNAFSGTDDSYFYTKYKFYFSANNGTDGIELWETDGTTAGTVMIQDIYPGANSSNPEFFGVAFANNKLVLRGTTAGGNNIYYLNTSVVPFPLLLTDFSAQLKNDRAELNWTTQQEVNFSHFNIQRSITGADFTTIGRVTGNGGTSLNNYTYTDPQLNKARTYYYRLELLDNDGKKTYSNIIALKLKIGFDFSLVSTKNEAIITVSDADGIIIGLKLVDVNGRVFSQRQQKVVTGESIKLPTGHLPPGVYVVAIECNGMIRTERFIR